MCLKNIDQGYTLNISRTAKEHSLAFTFYTFLSLLFFNEVILQKKWFLDDFLIQNFPNRYYAALEINNGSFPLWNPYIFSGMPFFADIQTAVLYPFNLLLSLFVTDDSLSYALLEYQVIFHLILGGFFMYLFTRSLNLSFSSSLLGGILFTFSGFFVNHTHHINMIHSATWLPAIFYSCNLAYNRDVRYLWACPLLLAVSLFGGHPQITIIIVYAFTFYYFFLAYLFRNSIKPLFSIYRFVFVIVIFLFLSLVHILPTYEFLQHTVRSSLSVNGAMKASLPAQNLLTFLMPDLFIPYKDDWKIWEFSCYMSVGAMILACFCLFRPKKETIFFLIMALFSLLFALGENAIIYKALYFLVPGFKLIRIPARFIFMFTFFLAILSAYGFHFITNTDFATFMQNGRKWIKTCIIPAFFLLAIPIITCAIIQRPYSEYSSDLYSYLLISCFFFLLLFITFKIREKFKGAKFILLLIIVLDLFYNRGAFNQTQITKEQSWGAIHYSAVGAVLKNADSGTRFFTGSKYAFYSNFGLIYRKSNLSGYNPFHLKSYAGIDLTSPEIASLLGARFIDFNDKAIFSKRWDKQTSFKTTHGFFINENAFPPAFLVGKSKYDPLFNLQTSIHNGEFDPLNEVYLEKNIQGIETYNLTPPEYNITKYEKKGNEVLVDLENSTKGFLVINEIYYPGWKVYVNGVEKEVLKANGIFRAVQIEKVSKNKVKFIFKPSSFIWGSFISIVTFLVMLLTLSVNLFNTSRKMKITL